MPFPEVGSATEDFALEDLASGETVSLSGFRGEKAVFLNFWASWCPFCVDEMPDMATVQKEHPDDLVVLAVNRKEPRSVAERFAKEVGVQYLSTAPRS